LQFAASLPRKPLTLVIVRDRLTEMAEHPDWAPTTVKRKVAAVRAFIRATDEALALNTFGSWKLKIRVPARLPKAIARKELTALLKLADTRATIAPGFSASVHPLVHPFQPIHLSPKAGSLKTVLRGYSQTDIVQGVDISRVFGITSERPRTAEKAKSGGQGVLIKIEFSVFFQTDIPTHFLYPPCHRIGTNATCDE
jgi:hypothetical protein